MGRREKRESPPEAVKDGRRENLPVKLVKDGEKGSAPPFLPSPRAVGRRCPGGADEGWLSLHEGEKESEEAISA